MVSFKSFLEKNPPIWQIIQTLDAKWEKESPIVSSYLLETPFSSLLEPRQLELLQMLDVAPSERKIGKEKLSTSK